MSSGSGSGVTARAPLGNASDAGVIDGSKRPTENGDVTSAQGTPLHQQSSPIKPINLLPQVVSIKNNQN